MGTRHLQRLQAELLPEHESSSASGSDDEHSPVVTRPAMFALLEEDEVRTCPAHPALCTPGFVKVQCRKRQELRLRGWCNSPGMDFDKCFYGQARF
jgi:hypothetical protein